MTYSVTLEQIRNRVIEAYEQRFGEIPMSAVRMYGADLPEMASKALESGAPVKAWEELKEAEANDRQDASRNNLIGEPDY